MTDEQVMPQVGDIIECVVSKYPDKWLQAEVLKYDVRSGFAVNVINTDILDWTRHFRSIKTNPANVRVTD